ncbi:hypothetical protein [Cryobacterium sp. AP23]
MSKFRLEINIPGFNEVRRSPDVQGDLMKRANAISAAAGGAEDFLVINATGQTRARVVVVTATMDAMKAEAEDQALTRAFDAGRS